MGPFGVSHALRVDFMSLFLKPSHVKKGGRWDMGFYFKATLLPKRREMGHGTLGVVIKAKVLLHCMLHAEIYISAC